MKMTDVFLEQLDKEATRTRRTLERVPEGRDDWKPHDKSMPLGRLAMLVAQMPSWIGMIVKQDQLDVRPPAGSPTSISVRCAPAANSSRRTTRP